MDGAKAMTNEALPLGLAPFQDMLNLQLWLTRQD
jgi:hypothetical protein